jgi:hypothetical protein
MFDWSSRPTHEVPADPATFNTAPPWLIQSISERPELVPWLFNDTAGMDAAKRAWASLPKDKQTEKLCWALTEFRKQNNLPEPSNNPQATGPTVPTTPDPRQMSIPIPGQPQPGYPPVSQPQPAPPPVYAQNVPQPGYPPQGAAAPQPSYPQPAAPPPVQMQMPPPPPVYGQPQQMQPQFQMPPAPMYQPQQAPPPPQPTPAYQPNPAAAPPPFLGGPQPASVPTTPSASSEKTEGLSEFREIITSLTRMYEYQTELLLLNAAIGTAILRRAGVDAPLAEILRAHREELLQVK